MLPNRTLDRKVSVPALVPNPGSFLIISGLAGAAKDAGQLTQESANAFLLGGAMGGGAPMAFGLALAQPDRRVLAIVGDADLTMTLGALATIGVRRPKNLAILCVDNGHFGETGYQEAHTNTTLNLAKVAEGCGLNSIHTVSEEADIPAARDALEHDDGVVFVWLRTNTEPAPKYARNWDAVERKIIFRRNLGLGN